MFFLQFCIFAQIHLKLRQYLSILDNILKSDIRRREVDFKFGFATSADVVKEASGLRLEAIRVIAREQSVEIEDTTCRCIDENLLAALADAHVRKMRAYFNNANKHITMLTGDEMVTFIDFCETFKKRHSSNKTVQSWMDIDADAIRQQFIQKVHKLTSPVFDLFSGIGNIYIKEIVASLSCKPNDSLDLFRFNWRDNVIISVLQSDFFNKKAEDKHQDYIDNRSIVRRITLSARYHIYTSEDDDHQQDTITIVNIHRALAMVA